MYFVEYMVRIYRTLRGRLPRVILLLFVAWNFLDVLRVRYALSSAPREPSASRTVLKERIFIASIHWNNEAVIREYWSDAVLALVDHLGPSNVYVSVYESGSWDDTKGALRLLDSQLDARGVQKTIVLDATTHADELAAPPAPTGWIDTPRGMKELRRIPYLSRIRNLSLRPLEDLAEQGKVFDKILFLNDVVFETRDVLNLLDTNGGVYAAACAMDYSKAPKFYDTFALRDSEGSEAIMQTWPYFGSGKTRSAIKHSKPARVESCWNGMVSMDAKPFYSHTSASRTALRFRGISDGLAMYHLEGSECCLIHADNPFTAVQGVWLNPNVRVGYSGPAYEAVNPKKGHWLSSTEILTGLWKNRFRRLSPVTWIKYWSAVWLVDRRIRDWRKAQGSEPEPEPGRHCLINEMQVLVFNGWAHV